jgi:hypothetical protein
MPGQKGQKGQKGGDNHGLFDDRIGALSQNSFSG